MFMIKMLLRKLRRRFFNYGTIMKTFIKAEKKLNKYRGEMLDEAREYGDMIVMAQLAKRDVEALATRSKKSLKILADITEGV